MLVPYDELDCFLLNAQEVARFKSDYEEGFFLADGDQASDSASASSSSKGKPTYSSANALWWVSFCSSSS